jgi:hypothetical protein
MGIQIFPQPEIEGGGGYKWEFLATIAMGTGSPSSITFSAIDPKYRALILQIFRPRSATAGTDAIRFNSLTGGFDYTRMALRYATTAQNQEGAGLSDRLQLHTQDYSAGTEHFGEYLIELTNIAAPTTVRGINSIGINQTHLTYGRVNDNAVINSLTVIRSAGTWSQGDAVLLGSE